MDRLVEEPQTETKETHPAVKIKLKETTPISQTEQNVEKTTEVPEQESENSRYINSFKDITVADIKRQQEEKEVAEFEKQKEDLIQAQFSSSPAQVEEKQEKTQSVNVKVIEKPNYDLIEENKKIIKLKKKTKSKSINKKKVAGIVLACTLGASAIVCVTNAVMIDSMNSSFVQIDETYNLNLAKYLKNLYKLDTTKNSMDIIETYPEEKHEAGDLGQHSNWFDKICSFIAGLFGG